MANEEIEKFYFSATGGRIIDRGEESRRRGDRLTIWHNPEFEVTPGTRITVVAKKVKGDPDYKDVSVTFSFNRDSNHRIIHPNVEKTGKMEVTNTIVVPDDVNEITAYIHHDTWTTVFGCNVTWKVVKKYTGATPPRTDLPSNSGIVFQSTGSDHLHYRILNNNSVEVTGAVRSTHQGRVEIPNAVQHKGKTYTVVRIGKSAFSYQNQITSVVVPSTVTQIGDSAFFHCNKLSSISIQGQLKKFGVFVTAYCPSLSNVSMIKPKQFKVIGSYVYDISHKHLLAGWGHGVVNVNEPVTVIKGAFAGSSVTHVVFKGKETKLGEKCFENCSKLVYVDILKKYRFSDKAFVGCWNMKALRLKLEPNQNNSLKSTSAKIEYVRNL